MPPQDSLPFLPDSPGLSLLSPLFPLASPLYLFTPELSTSALVQSNHTSLLPLAFLFNQSAYLVEPEPDLPSSLSLLLPEVTGPLPPPSILPVPVPVPVSLPAPVINLVNLNQLPANP